MTCLSGVAKMLNPDAKFYDLDFRSPDVSKVFEDEQFDVMNHHAVQMDVQRSLQDPIMTQMSIYWPQ